MDHPFIRPAVLSERSELERLQRRASLAIAEYRDALLAHPDAIEVPLDQIVSGAVLVAEWNGTIVGFASVEPRKDGDSELDALFVEPKMQRRGIGRSLIVRCTEVARARGSAALCVLGNPHARQFYEACGFKVIGTAETRFGAAPLLRKPL
jgi:GNAT superfamily N-acetyltransferase